MSTRSHPLAGDRGSIPMALIAVMAIASLATVLAASVVTGQRQTRFDQSYERSLQTAEAVLERMISRVESLEADDSFTVDEVIDDYDVEGEAVRDAATRTWVLSATSTAPDGTSRTVEVTVEQDSLFNVAAFGKIVTDFNGANGADSYRSSERNADGSWDIYDYTTYLDGGNEVVPPNGDTGKGVVATNGKLFLKGQAMNDSDGAEIHFAMENVDDPLPGATGYCAGAATTCSQYVADNAGKLRYYRDPIEFPAVELPSEPTGHFDGDGETLGPGVHVFTSAKLYSTTQITGTPEDPTIIYLSGQLSVPNHNKVNFETVGGIDRPRPSPSLIIRSASEGVAMNFATHVQISALIYAPNGAFGGGSQGHIWGSLIAGGIDNTGGWQFHYDEAAADIDDVTAPQAADWVER